MFIGVGFVLLMVNGLQELDPVYDYELNDEVAKSQERSVWIACLFLAYSHIDFATEKILDLQTRTGFSLPQIKRKISAGILEKCSNTITWKEAEGIISGTIDEKYKELVEYDITNFDISLTPTQSSLISQIEKFINEKPEDSFPPPPTSQGTELTEDNSNFLYLGFLGLIPIIWFLWPKKSSPKIEEKKPKRKNK